MSEIKERILNNLSKTDYISGVDLAHQLEVTKVAVWKQIQSLKEMGYTIKSKPGVGYQLVDTPDSLHPYEIKRNLETELIGKKIYHYPQVDSTQEIAKELALKGSNQGTVIIAKTQTAGKGRRKRHWFSPSGGIYMSLILRPEIVSSQTPLMGLLIGVAIAKSIRELYSLKAKLKWPNDIQIKERKVGGILIEIAAESDYINWMSIGIGINVKNKSTSLPSEILPNSTFLEVEYENEVSKTELIRKLLKEVEKLYMTFKEQDSSCILEKWRSMSNTLGTSIQVTNGERIKGKAIDVDQNGALIIKLKDDTLKKVTAGDVSLRKDN